MGVVEMDMASMRARTCGGRASAAAGWSCRSSQRAAPRDCISAAPAESAPQVTRFSSCRSWTLSGAAATGVAMRAAQQTAKQETRDMTLEG